mmetsp:Transcript_2889/g.3963  ORF Transcript_2889/g.3963 Transcript_2889/m.3963 type:complete len:182 (+) Transcript_2889:460-1005(+)
MILPTLPCKISLGLNEVSRDSVLGVFVGFGEELGDELGVMLGTVDGLGLGSLEMDEGEELGDELGVMLGTVDGLGLGSLEMDEDIDGPGEILKSIDGNCDGASVILITVASPVEFLKSDVSAVILVRASSAAVTRSVTSVLSEAGPGNRVTIVVMKLTAKLLSINVRSLCFLLLGSNFMIF